MSGGQGRGRGQAQGLAGMEEEQDRPRFRGQARPSTSGLPTLDPAGGTSSPESSSSGEKTVRGRGGFKSQELHTIPQNVVSVRSPADAKGQPIEVLANFIRIEPRKEGKVFAYRVDFEPSVESITLRSQLFRRSTLELLPDSIFDGASEARSSTRLPEQTTTVQATSQHQPDQTWTITIKRVADVAYGTFEMVRVYNMHMKAFLRSMQFFQVQSGAYIHPELRNKVGNTGLLMVRGYRTGANLHEDNQILMNLESVHKLIQEQNLLAMMTQMRRAPGDMRQNIKAALTGKLVVTNYNKIVYRVEDVNFNLTPRSTFRDKKTGQDVSYLEYYRTKYGTVIHEQTQPLLLVIQNNRRRQQEEQGGDSEDIYVVPELCNMAGLTDFQRNDNRLKIDLIKSSQIDPKTRVEHMETFLRKLHESQTVNEKLRLWGYSYERTPVRVKARILPLEKIGAGRNATQPPETWPKVDADGGFEKLVVHGNLASAPRFPKMVIVVARSESQCEGAILNKLKGAFQKINLKPDEVEVVRITTGESPHLYVQHLKNLSRDTTCAIVLMTNQNKEKYNAIKKLCCVEQGIVTQVVTAKLMMDDRKANGAAVKIGIQIAAKIGGEPWYVYFPLSAAMICGYDTYHDTAQRGRSYGAFVASMNRKLSSWYSKADCHDHLDELSSHMAENLGHAMRRYREKNQTKLSRIFIYRDGVGDGQLDHVYKVELKQILRAIREFDDTIQLTFIVVNKRVGARFYMSSNNSYANPPPGSVIDNVVTRKERYDFYLISQSTRHGVVAPTYYNILHDESQMSVDKHQQMAYKLCFLYYNWTGTVRVPAPCQYAHKLALLCGEHLHGVPNTILDDKLHFL